MQHVAGLVSLPPTEEVGLDAEPLERSTGLEDLSLQAAVREREGLQLIEEDLHSS